MVMIRCARFAARPAPTRRFVRLAAALAALLLASACTVGGVATIAPYRGRPIDTLTARPIVSVPAGALALSPDGALLAVPDDASGMCLRSTSPRGSAPLCADIGSIGSAAGTVRLPLSAAFSPDGRWVALGLNVTAQGGGPVWLVDARTGSALPVPSVDGTPRPTSDGGSSPAAPSPSGAAGAGRGSSYIAMTWATRGDLLLISSAFDAAGARTRLVEVDPGSLVPRVVAVATGPFEFQSGHLASGGATVLFTVFRGDQLEPDLVVVDLDTGRRKEFGPLGPNGTQLTPLAVSPDGRLSLVGSATLGHAGPPHLLDIASGLLTDLPGVTGDFASGSFSPDGARVATLCSAGGTTVLTVTALGRSPTPRARTLSTISGLPGPQGQLSWSRFDVLTSFGGRPAAAGSAVGWQLAGAR